MRSLKNWIKRYSGALAAFALVVTSLVANSTCIYLMHQDELPESAKKLRKF
ncbi:MAG: cyclic lactone autoinducer peptide [Ruminococcus sp.]|nr:cyclic lactone autoinducer peptide [Ruminococcus sp.]